RMEPAGKPHLLQPFIRAVSQFDDPTFRGVLLRSLAWSIACFAALHVGAVGTMYFDRIAQSVERRFYPWLPAPNGASFIEQAWDGVAVGLQVLALNIVALILALILPGVGLIL